MAEVYREMSKNTGLDFSAVVRLMDNLPIFLSGNPHKERRREMAKVYAATRAQQDQAIEYALENIATRIEATHGAFDLFQEVSVPIWDAIFGAICPAKTALQELVSELPELFYPGTSVRHRKRLNDKLEVVLRESGDELLDQIALLTLGVRPLTATLALSLHKLARDNAGSRLCDIVFPASYPESALRFVDRIALQEVRPDGCPHPAGTRFRCISFDETYTPEQNEKSLYGMGAHVCLGRPISQFIWGRIGAFFAKSEKTIHPGELSVTVREPFVLPTTCIVIVSN